MGGLTWGPAITVTNLWVLPSLRLALHWRLNARLAELCSSPLWPSLGDALFAWSMGGTGLLATASGFLHAHWEEFSDRLTNRVSVASAMA